MSLDEYHLINGAPVSFDRQTVTYLAPHESGQGTVVSLGTAPHHRELHLRQDYEFLRGRITESTMDRAIRQMREDPTSPYYEATEQA